MSPMFKKALIAFITYNRVKLLVFTISSVIYETHWIDIKESNNYCNDTTENNSWSHR